ncbi:MAG: EAL domain-containing protein (putative c-di-GMP-specific phosphodiesterase class I) [Lysobacterales bacterium]|jgi:EAL domain-containing protein (putative c-di-GMP-specific phosphodiesterase class I)/CheY-like chemotaxis protein
MIEKINNKKNILLVDDDRPMSDMLRMLLETRGYGVDVAFSSEELFKVVSDTTDLIILDLGLPDAYGFDVCRKLKEVTKTSHIPIIILSAQFVPGDVVEGLYSGADDCVCKPFEYEELVARIEVITRRAECGNGKEIKSKDLGVIKELARIIKDEDVVPFFQPIVNLYDMNIYGFEALCRPNTTTSLSNPEVLFKTAIQFGFYQDLELLAWRKAMDYAANNVGDAKLFLNCNPYFVEGNRFDEIKLLLENIGLEPSDIVLEITERSAILDYDQFYNKLTEFREDGFKFAVDDVGGGFASLESIVKTKPEILKIDRHIVTGLHEDSYKQSIIKFIVSFCKENDTFCIAEGIEHKAELEVLKALGVQGGQGYYLYKPSPIIDLKSMQKVILAC